MKLQKRLVDKIIATYNLGKIKSIQPLSRGLVNYNFSLKTEKGEFIVRRLGYRVNNHWWMKQKQLQYKVLAYLKKRNFPYEVPDFLKNSYGNIVSRVENHYFEVYRKIEGKCIININDRQYKEIAKALAIYHKTIKNFSENNKRKKKADFSWLLEKYARLKKIIPKTKLDFLMLKHLKSFEELLKKLLKLNLTRNIFVTHSDFSQDNLIFRNNRLVGIIDFENVQWDPKAKDVAYASWTAKTITAKDIMIFVKEYKRYNNLTDEEVENIIPLSLLENCNNFWWFYAGMRKRPDLKYQSLLRTIRNKEKFLNMLDNYPKSLRNTAQVKKS